MLKHTNNAKEPGNFWIPEPDWGAMGAALSPHFPSPQCLVLKSKTAAFLLNEGGKHLILDLSKYAQNNELGQTSMLHNTYQYDMLSQIFFGFSIEVSQEI